MREATKRTRGVVALGPRFAIAALLAGGMASAQDTGSARATWNDGVLEVIGTAADDDLSIASKGELIEVNGGLVPVLGGTPTVRNTHTINVDAGDGDDHVVFSEWGAPLPDATIAGGRGNDILLAGSGNDVLRGGAGNDTLLGNRGNDIVLGEDGSDLLIVNNGDGSDFLEGGEGNDLVQVNGANGAEDDIAIVPARAESGHSGGAHVLYGDGAVIFLTDSISVEVFGHGGDDTLSSELAADSGIDVSLDGGEGNDLLIGSDGADVLLGGAGNDTLLGNRGNDIVLGQDGNDLLIVNNGDGSDFLETGADTDFLDGGAGQDTAQIIGSERDDQVEIGPADTGARVVGDGFAAELSGVETVDVDGQGGSDVIIGSVGLNGLISLDLDGGEGNDLLIGGDGSDVLLGGAGRDRCDGNGGRDTFLGCEVRMGRP